jgi:hypothetical protein
VTVTIAQLQRDYIAVARRRSTMDEKDKVPVLEVDKIDPGVSLRFLDSPKPNSIIYYQFQYVYTHVVRVLRQTLQ